MKQNTGYSICMDGGDLTALKVGAAKEKPYRVEWIKTISAGKDGAPERMRREDMPDSQTILILPGDDISILSVMLPEMNRKQMHAALRGIAAREKGGQQDDWIIDFRVSRGNGASGAPKSRIKVTGVVADRMRVEQSYAEAKNIGFAPRKALPGFIALELLLRIGKPDIAASGGWLLVFLGEKERFLCVGDSESLLLSRILPKDLSGGIERDEYAGKMAVEVERSAFFARQAENSVEVKHIVVCGDPEGCDKLVENLAGRSDWDVVRWKPEELFEAETEEGLWKHSLELAAAAAVLQGHSCNLLPRELSGESARPAFRRAAIASAACFGAVVPILLVGGMRTDAIQKKFLRDASARIGELQGRSENAAGAYLRNRSIKICRENIDKYGMGRPELARVLDEIALRAPSDIVFENLRVEDGGDGPPGLVLRGTSLAGSGERAQEIFLRFLGAMDDCPGLARKSEPSFLEIGGIDSEDLVRTRVAFTIEYDIVGDVVE